MRGPTYLRKKSRLKFHWTRASTDSAQEIDKRQRSRRWNKLVGYCQRNLLLAQPTRKISKEMLKIKRKQARTIIRLITGHSGHRKHLPQHRNSAKLYHIAEEI